MDTKPITPASIGDPPDMVTSRDAGPLAAILSPMTIRPGSRLHICLGRAGHAH
jgi:hypothetical protein